MIYNDSLSYYDLLSIMSAAITPGTQPRQVSNKTIRIEPHPLSYTASGGKIIDRITLKSDIVLCFTNHYSTILFYYLRLNLG